MQGSNSHQIQSSFSFSTGDARARLRVSSVRSHNSYQIIIILSINSLPFRGTADGCCIVESSEGTVVAQLPGSLCIAHLQLTMSTILELAPNTNKKHLRTGMRSQSHYKTQLSTLLPSAWFCHFAPAALHGIADECRRFLALIDLFPPFPAPWHSRRLSGRMIGPGVSRAQRSQATRMSGKN